MNNILNFIKKYKTDLLYFIGAIIVLGIIKFLFNLIFVPLLIAVVVYFFTVKNTYVTSLFNAAKTWLTNLKIKL